jgi:hypothetical protein
VQIRKGFVGKRPPTSARPTPAGCTSFEQHVAALQESCPAPAPRSCPASSTHRRRQSRYEEPFGEATADVHQLLMAPATRSGASFIGKW